MLGFLLILDFYILRNILRHEAKLLVNLEGKSIKLVIFRR